MEFDVAATKYQCKVILTTGDILDLTNICMSLSWSEQKGGLAASASATMANTKIEQGYISDILKLCSIFVVMANDKKVFQGVIWQWSYTSAKQYELSVTAYDRLIYLTQTKDYSYYTGGKSTQDIVTEICNRKGIPLKYEWESFTHAKTKMAIQPISEHILGVLDEAQTKIDSKYVALMDYEDNGGEFFSIRKRGQNKDIYVFHFNNVISTRNQLSLQNLVTKVKIMGKSEEYRRPDVIDTIDGKLEYGILEEIVTKETNITMEDARKEGNNILREKGKPEQSVQVSAVDVPFVRKGDKIKITAGNLSGYFYLMGVTHNATDKTMEMELARE